MYKKDYIVRQFEEFGKVLGVLLFLKKEKDWEKFSKEISEATQKFTSLEIGYVEKLGMDAFKSELLENEKINLEQKRILAGILFEKLDYFGQHEMKAEQLACAEKCLLLYTFIYENKTQNEFDLEVFYRIEFLRKMLY
jgi:hypothetical protein